MREFWSMDNRFLMSILICISCGQSPDYKSTNGVSYFFNESRWEHVQIEEQETWFINEVSNVPGYSISSVMESLQCVEVHLWSTPIPCGHGTCNGIQNHNILSVRSNVCPFESALTHEMAHWLQQSIHSTNDYNHDEVSLWKIADSRPRKCP